MARARARARARTLKKDCEKSSVPFLTIDPKLLKLQSGD